MEPIFWIALIAGLVCLSLSHIFDIGGHDADFGHDHGGDGESDGLMTNLFTLRNFFIFALGFGASGAIAARLGANDLIASIWGLVAGVLLALLGSALYRAMRGQQASSLTHSNALVGKRAKVLTAIPSGGRGEITTTNAQGTTVALPARSSSGEIVQNTIVNITAMDGDTATVEPIV